MDREGIHYISGLYMASLFFSSLIIQPNLSPSDLLRICSAFASGRPIKCYSEICSNLEFYFRAVFFHLLRPLYNRLLHLVEEIEYHGRTLSHLSLRGEDKV